MNAREVATVAQAAGFRQPNLQTMVAIALAESGGNPAAHHVTSREDSRGLWQINVRAWPQFASSNLYDPNVNAQAAKTVLAQQGFRAWSTFTFGKFLLYMPTAGAAVGSLPPAAKISDNPLVDPVGAVAKPVTDITGATREIAHNVGQGVGLAAKAGTWIANPQNLLRVVYVLTGGFLLVAALVLVAEPAVRPYVEAAGKVAAV